MLADFEGVQLRVELSFMSTIFTSAAETIIRKCVSISVVSAARVSWCCCQIKKAKQRLRKILAKITYPRNLTGRSTTSPFSWKKKKKKMGIKWIRENQIQICNFRPKIQTNQPKIWTWAHRARARQARERLQDCLQQRLPLKKKKYPLKN